MTTHEQVEQAAGNNAIWCDTVCRAHGKPGEFLEDLWINRHEAPRFYPNAVTLSNRQVAAQLAEIQMLDQTKLGGWGVKDSFCTLDLAPFGYRVLFTAEWIYRSASLPKPDPRLSNVRWATIKDASALAAWEAAWSDAPAGALPSTEARVFVPSLLADKTVAFIAAYQQQHIIAGAIANRTGDGVGLSNVFVPTQEADRFWAGCVARVIETFPGLPIVGYEAGSSLAQAQSVGFEAVAPLRVWVKEVLTP